jgi:HAE1 family hydrophobic/amphiphilic exporter-1
VRAQGRLESEEEFGNIVIRANQDGSMVRLKDVARIELGAQMYNIIGRMNGKPAALIAIYQLPGSNAIQTMDAATKLMEEMKGQFPPDLDYVTALDTTQAVREGIKEIVHTLFEALILVIIVVYIFLQGWRATLIPLLAVPVSLIGTFTLFPLLGFSINTLSLFGPSSSWKPWSTTSSTGCHQRKPASGRWRKSRGLSSRSHSSWRQYSSRRHLFQGLQDVSINNSP